MTHLLIYHALDSDAEPHGIDDAADLSVVVREESFCEQIRFLSEAGKTVLSLDELLRSESAPNENRVVLTFDDGHRSNYTIAMPHLMEAGFSATFYVIAGFVDRNPEYVTSRQLREMVTAGMHIGAHSVTHRWLPLLAPDEVRRELSDSRAMLEDILGQQVLDFALPGGHYDPWMLDAARETGYRSVATSKAGTLRTNQNLLKLPRMEIRRGLSIAGFQQKFEKATLLRLRIAEAGKSCVRRTLGLSRYLKLRRLAHRALRLDR